MRWPASPYPRARSSTSRVSWRRITVTEPVYKLYAESFAGPDHLQQIQNEAQAIIAGALAD